MKFSSLQKTGVSLAFAGVLAAACSDSGSEPDSNSGGQGGASHGGAGPSHTGGKPGAFGGAGAHAGAGGSVLHGGTPSAGGSANGGSEMEGGWAGTLGGSESAGAGGEEAGTGGLPSQGGQAGEGAGGQAGSAGTAGQGGTHGRAHNACGSPSFAELNPAPISGDTVRLLDFGYSQAPLFEAGDRVATTGGDGGWILWDVLVGQQITHGSGKLLDLEGSTFLAGIYPVNEVQYPSKVEVRSAVDGALMASLITQGMATSFQLSWDGQYVIATQPATKGVVAWKSDGTLLGSFVPDVSFTDVALPASAPGKAFAASDRVWQYDLATGVAAPVSPSFLGTFAGWFPDGARFVTSEVTNVGAVKTIRTYTRDGQLLGTKTLTSTSSLISVGGAQDQIWVATITDTSPSVSVYPALGDAATAALTLDGNVVRVDGNFVGVSSGTTLSVIDLRSPAAATTVPGPLQMAASRSGGGWSTVQSPSGVLQLHGSSGHPATPIVANCGHSLALGGSASGIAAFVASTGEVILLDVVSHDVVQTLHLSNEPSLLLRAHVEVSDDGKTLVVAESSNPDKWTNVEVFDSSLGVATSLYQGTLGDDFRLSANGARFSRGCTVTNRDGSSAVQLLQYGTCCVTPLSPSSTRLATNGFDPYLESTPRSIVPPYLFEQDLPVATLAQDTWAVGWLDESRVLVANYSYPKGISRYVYQSSTIYDFQGHVLSGVLPLPEMQRFYVVAPNRILSANDANVYSLESGASVWSPGFADVAALAGGLVITRSLSSGPEGVFATRLPSL